jgi:DNA-binding transcriptional regulator PaaX
MSRKAKIQEKLLEKIASKKAVNREIFDEEKDSKEKYAISRSLKNLSESGFIEEIPTERSSFLRLTPEGRQKLRNIKLSTPTSLVDTRWDGFWRMIMIDFPESRKSERDSIRYILKKAGFLCMKNSVWISPLPLEHLFMNIKTDMGLHEEVMIVVTQSIDPITDKTLRESFGME